MQKVNYFIVYAMWSLMAMLPLKLLYVLGDIIYFPLYYIFRYRRKVVRNNLKNAFPEKTEKEIVAIEKKFYFSLCDYVVETVKLMRMSPKTIKKHLRFEGTEDVKRFAVQEGRSCVVYMGHNFNWEFVTSLPLHFGNDKIQFGQIYHPLANKAMDRLFLNLRNQYGAESISMAKTLRRILQLNKEGKPFVIGFIADQVPTWEAINHWLLFLNQDTPVFTGTEKIAQRTASAVFYMSLHRECRGHYVAKFHLVSEDASKTADNELTDKYFKMLEDDIKSEPYLWLWAHKRWKRTRKGYAEREAKRETDKKRLRELNE